MLEALGIGALASGALVIGAVAGLWLRLPERVLAIMLSFASGALITALAFELFEDSYEQGGLWRAALGMLAGALVFVVLSGALDRWAGTGHPAEEQGSVKLDKDAATTERPAGPESTHGAAGLALLAGVTLDGLPENIALGVSLGEGTGGLALLAAIFVSNLPEALVGSASMRAQGRSNTWVIGTWTICGLLLAACVALGAGPLSSASQETISLPLAFAGGAVLASLADTLMPEAYEHGGPQVALATTAGFFLSYLLATI
jgi:ZIP family zinc transporter